MNHDFRNYFSKRCELSREISRLNELRHKEPKDSLKRIEYGKEMDKIFLEIQRLEEEYRKNHPFNFRGI